VVGATSSEGFSSAVGAYLNALLPQQRWNISIYERKEVEPQFNIGIYYCYFFGLKVNLYRLKVHFTVSALL